MAKKVKRQWGLRILLAVVLLTIAVLVETIGMHPSGIYYYSQNGYKEFGIGDEKARVLRQINFHKTIRSIITCSPDSIVEKVSRRKLEMSQALMESDIWICRDKTGKAYFFRFEDQKLTLLLIQRLRFWEKEGSKLFSDCSVLKDIGIEHYLNTEETLTVYNKDS